MLKYLLIFCMSLATVSLNAKDVQECTAQRSTLKPKIDGILDDEAWDVVEPFFDGNFTGYEPSNGSISAFRTAIKIIYTDEALYVAARMFDPNPDSIRHELGIRDDGERNTDIFAFAIDTYKKGQNAFSFMVTAAGVQVDEYITPDNFDRSWDAIWKSGVKRDSLGWVAEFEVPYSALRFAKADEQVWGINFMRHVKRAGETAFWNPVDNSVQGFVNQFGVVKGLNNISPPFRMMLIPYVSTYYNNYPDGNTDRSITGGLDLKMGLSESFTLDMSLIPDFGQVQSDNVVLNLSPFEVFFQENRPFFTEGMDLFNKGNLFYSRRIGKSFGVIGEIHENETLLYAPNDAPLINTTKISGRTKNGLGIGVINALTNKTYAIVENNETGVQREVLADPLTNFNVMVVDKALKNNSNFSLINTNVSRFGGDNSNVSGTDFRLYSKNNTYRIKGFAAYSHRAIHQGERNSYVSDNGFKTTLDIGKVSGKIQYGINQNIESDRYNPNDLGYLQSPNEVNHYAYFSYNIFKPFSIFQTLSTESGIWHNMLYKPNKFSGLGIWNTINMKFKNFWYFGANYGTRPKNSYDFFDPRTDGYSFIKPKNYNIDSWAGTDERKKLAVQFSAGYWQRRVWDQIDNWGSITPRYRVNNHLTFNHSIDFRRVRREIGFATKTFHEDESLDEVIFGKRYVNTLTNTFNAAFTLNSKMGLTLRVRHYWSKVRYVDFFHLNPEGTLSETQYTGLDDANNPKHNANFNAFNVDMVYSYQFAPGSFIRAVWKNSIYTHSTSEQPQYWDNLTQMLESPQTNSLSVRLIYFLDYQTIKKLGRKSI